MQSDGGLAPVDQFSGSRAILSGPAGEFSLNFTDSLSVPMSRL